MDVNFFRCYARLQAVITQTALACGRSPTEIRLIGVTKTHPQAVAEQALRAGLCDLGENKVQEAQAKFTLNGERLPAFAGARLHFIGSLQSNKALLAVGLFDVIHSLDRPQLADKLAQALAQSPRRPQILVQVNSGREPQKAGVAPDGLEALLSHSQKIGLTVSGLMCIPPAGLPARSYFEELAELARRYDLPELSMGMSADYKEAIACGATYIRVGSALFGHRNRMDGLDSDINR